MNRAARRAQQAAFRRGARRFSPGLTAEDLVAAMLEPGALVVPLVDIPPDIRPHFDAVIESVRRLGSARLAGIEVIAVAAPGLTGTIYLPRADLARGLDVLRPLGAEIVERIASELAQPVAAGRTRITLIGEDGALYFAGVRWSTLSPGGAA